LLLDIVSQMLKSKASAALYPVYPLLSFDANVPGRCEGNGLKWPIYYELQQRGRGVIFQTIKRESGVFFHNAQGGSLRCAKRFMFLKETEKTGLA
jgi:hypothetical protein